MERKFLIALCVLASSLGACATQTDYAARQSPAHLQAQRAIMSANAEILRTGLPAAHQPMAIADLTMPPRGYLEYCVRTPSECPSDMRRAEYKEALNAQRWAELVAVNTQVNNSVRYVTDAALYEQAEYWTYPNGRGDCEDYVLAKRKMLMDRGWAAESLLIGVALDLDNLRHAVLIVATDRGDFVLDNQLSSVVAWADTGYTWEKRQTTANPNVWVALTGDAMPLTPYEAPVVPPVLVADAVQPTPEQTPSALQAPLAQAAVAQIALLEPGRLGDVLDDTAAAPALRLPLARPAALQIAVDESTQPQPNDPTAAGA